MRLPLTPEKRAAGKRLGERLRHARGGRILADVAQEAGMTLRKIETGRLATPAFTTIAALARVLPVSLDELAALCLPDTDLRQTG